MSHFSKVVMIRCGLENACYTYQGLVSRKSRKLFESEMPFLKLRPAYSVKLVFRYVAEGIKSKIAAKFCASRRLRFEDTKRIISSEMCPKSFRGVVSVVN